MDQKKEKRIAERKKKEVVGKSDIGLGAFVQRIHAVRKMACSWD